jgi:hypothetical protein
VVWDAKVRNLRFTPAPAIRLENFTKAYKNKAIAEEEHANRPRRNYVTKEGLRETAPNMTRPGVGYAAERVRISLRLSSVVICAKRRWCLCVEVITPSDFMPGDKNFFKRLTLKRRVKYGYHSFYVVSPGKRKRDGQTFRGATRSTRIHNHEGTVFQQRSKGGD